MPWTSMSMERFQKTMCMVALLCCVSSIHVATGRSVAVTESSVMAIASDYQYEDIGNTGFADRNSTKKNNTETTATDGAGDGMFYPLYGDAIDRMSSKSGGENQESQLPPQKSSQNRPAIQNFPDYTTVDETALPVGRRLNTQGPHATGFAGRQFWGGERDGWMMEQLRRGYRVPTQEGAWGPNGIRMGGDGRGWGGDDRRWGGDASRWGWDGRGWGGDGRGWGGDAMESLRKDFRIIKMFGLDHRLDELQTIYPHINVTRMYNYYQHTAMPMGGGGQMYGGEWDEQGANIGYWGNGTFNYYNRYPGYGSEDGFWYNGAYYPEMEDGIWYNGTYYPEMEDGIWYNGTYHPEMEDGIWYNGTYYPEMEDGIWYNGTYYPEMEDGFWYNGTYYPGEMEGPDMEDGYFYNGTFYYYPGEAEGPELEDGFFYNGTFYPGEQEAEEWGQGYGRENLMWWQRHHPRWQDRTNDVRQPWNHGKWPTGINDARGQPPNPFFSSLYPPKAFPFPGIQPGRYPVNPRQVTPVKAPPPLAKPPMAPSTNLSPPGVGAQPYALPQQQFNGRPGQALNPPPRRGQGQQLPQGIPKPRQGQRPRNYPGQQGRQTLPKPPSSQTRRYPLRPYANPRPRNPFNNNSRRRFPPPRMPNIRPPYNRNSGTFGGSRFPGPNTGPLSQAIMAGRGPNVHSMANPGAAATGKQQPSPPVHKKTDPLDPYRDTSTAAIGIIFACILGLTLIMAPLVCMLHNYRKNKRMKKRTFLKRPELSGSVDEGLLDAIVRTELGAVGGTAEQRPSTANDPRQSSPKKGLGFVTKVKNKGAELAEKRWKEKKGWNKGRPAQKSEDGAEAEGQRGGRRVIEMREMRADSRDADFTPRPLPALPQSHPSAFAAVHGRYNPRKTLIGAREELREAHAEASAPMSVVGMDSEDEQVVMRVVGK